MSNDNRAAYENPEVVAFYAESEALQPCEELLFDRHITPGMAVLDMGVGGGRTAPHLAARAGSYIGADYAQAMVDACRKRFPALDFRHCDASDMDEFADGSFDAMVFSFNGIDYLPDDAARARALGEAARVLKPGGVLIFSSHNARLVCEWPRLAGARPHQAAWRSVRALGLAARSLPGRLLSGLFGRGEGYTVEVAHSHMRNYASSPAAIRPQLAAAGLELIDIAGSAHPASVGLWGSAWIYYVARKGPRQSG